uniref:Caffeoyl-CoA O-methyltransferase n=1 Tax=Aegilops tauschii TaxID=37682 RepID=M8AV23_AEGTA
MASNGSAGEVRDVHSSETTKTLLKSNDLYDYMLKTMVYPRENEFMRELRQITNEHIFGFMSSPPDEGLVLSLLLKLMGGKRTIERVHVVAAGRGAGAVAAAQADGRQEDHRGRGELRLRLRGRRQVQLRQLPRAAAATLWGGTVAMPDDTPLTEEDRKKRDSIRGFNAMIAADTRVDPVQLPIADGITLCRRVV